MIKAKATGRDGKEIWLFGLSERNIELLKDDRPIRFEWPLKDGTSVTVYLCYGVTENAIREALAPLITPDTRIHGEEQ